MTNELSMAIETSCRAGGVTLAAGDELLGQIAFDASARHTTQLIRRLDDLLKASGCRPRDVDEVYVSVGPGSFTGLRVGISVARTAAQMMPGLRCVAVPTPQVVAENARALDWRHLGVIMDAREGFIYAALFAQVAGLVVPVGPGSVMTPQEFLAQSPRPLMLIGEGLEHHQITGKDVIAANWELNLPTSQGVWRVGRRLAEAGQFVEFSRLLPVYVHRPRATGPWDEQQAAEGGIC